MTTTGTWSYSNNLEDNNNNLEDNNNNLEDNVDNLEDNNKTIWRTTLITSGTWS